MRRFAAAFAGLALSALAGACTTTQERVGGAAAGGLAGAVVAGPVGAAAGAAAGAVFAPRAIRETRSELR